ncbi:hypothetical protein CAAN1_09S04412 [[Candida] anglica]|uniref:Altered inheritance of mitochondria protein 11 n=1 Tax=[Candida] anglica TaxID=148631 RepID=A0ABP0EJP2_9ASCO
MDLAEKFNFKIASASEEYKLRRRKQMILFMGTSALTLFATRLAYKSSVARQYLPTLFQGNHQPPASYSFVADAAVAVGTGTLLCGSVTSMTAFGAFWILDVSNFKEFGWKMKSMMGGYDRERELAKMPIDQESREIQEALNDILEGKYEE